MSRVGSVIIKIPSGVTVVRRGLRFEITGKVGKLVHEASGLLNFDSDDATLRVTPKGDTKEERILWGTTQRILANMVKGVHEGFSVDLEMVGTGYRASLEGSTLVLQLGFSHDVRYPIPEGIKITAEKPTSLRIFGADKQRVGQVAAEIRAYRPPEPYKGKGVNRVGEYVLRKEGKKK